MSCSQTIASSTFLFVVACAMYPPAALGQESSDEPAPAEVNVETTSIVDIVVNLFGGGSSASRETVEVVEQMSSAQPEPSPSAEAVVGETSPPLAPDAPVAKVDIQTTYADAVRESQLHNRPVLAILGAEWCVWCRKLEAELEMPAAESILKEWVVVEVNVDNEPDVAARLQASALPGLRILGPFQSLVASREGYLELAELKQWLAANRASADPSLHKALYDRAAPDKPAVDQLVSMLSQSSPMVRAAAMERLAAHPRQSASAIVQVLKTGRLVQQLCACEVLRRWSAPLASIDPWQPQTLETDEFASLMEWSRQRTDASDAANLEDSASRSQTEAAAVTPQIDSPAVNELLERLMKANPIDRPGLIAQLMGRGAALAAEVRSRLAQGDAVDDLAREALRELLYNLLASNQLRLQQSGVIAALGRLDSDSHRQAAASVLDHVAIIDQPLVDELARDADALVRELAVRALGRLGLLTDGDRIEHLLTDGSPNVRTAVLRALSEHPSDKAVESLCAYLQKETDEDLLVHGAKCLGQLANQPQAMSTLAQLAGNSSWRVRATAVEAAGQAIQQSTQQAAHVGGAANKGLVPEDLATAIVAAAFEKDAFVAERAATLLPTLLNEGVVDEMALETISKKLAERPEKLETLAGGTSHAARGRITPGGQQSYPALVNVAKKWLTQNEPIDIERAAILLSRLDPTSLNDRLGTLIASKDRSMRLAGLRAAIDSMESYRRTSIEAAVRTWRAQADEANPRRQPAITSWHEFPEAELVPSESANIKDLKPPHEEKSTSKINTSQNTPRTNDDVSDFFAGSPPAKAESPRPNTSALDAASDMFGDFPEAPNTKAGSGQSAIDDDVASRALPSKWMEHWQSGLPQTRPNWISACEQPTQALLNSTDPSERAAALALWLMLGHTAHGSEMLAAIDDSNKNTDELAFKLPQLLSWLPGPERLSAFKTLAAENEGDGERIIDVLDQITVIDDPQLAEWVFQKVDQELFSDPKLREQLSTTLLRALIGFTAETLPASLSPGDFQFSPQAPFRVMRSRKPFTLPGRIQACEWLGEHYRKSPSPRQRAIALAAVARLDHKTAVDAALGAIAEAEVDSELLQTALSIALYDAAAPSAERAIMLLSHRMPSVRSAALQLLAMPASKLRDSRQPIPPTIDENPAVLPGFWRTTQEFPLQILRELMETENDPMQQSRAILLLLAAGERVDLAPLERQLSASQGEFAKLSIAAALAKSGRTDDEAIKYYEQVYAESSTRAGGGDDRIAAALYETLRELRSDALAELRRRMRNEKGASLFNPDSTDDIFGSP
jgi:HEAT repeat protein/thiol-disulfide isomerase/thioredoxin/tetratricopeptide (TPR) repeat protein